jgi:glycosyltransferase involved in cell wall biosynthesis
MGVGYVDHTVSVIVPVKNEGSNIEKCLEAIFNQTLKPFEVIVVDGHSTDNTVENALKFAVKVYYEDYHTRAGANKVGVENAQGTFIAFTDADCIPQNDWVECLTKEFDESIVGVGGSIINIGNGLWEDSINLAMSTFFGSANSVQGRLFKSKKYVKSISGCNSMYRRSDIIKSGGFNVKLQTAEDTDLNNNMLRLGKLLYTPQAVILHDHKRGLKDFRKRMQQYGYGRAKSRLWDLQVIPPILGLMLACSLAFTPLIFVPMAGIYMVILVFMGLKFSLSKKDVRYLFSVPCVYIIEHLFYSLGFFKGILSYR